MKKQIQTNKYMLNSVAAVTELVEATTLNFEQMKKLTTRNSQLLNMKHIFTLIAILFLAKLNAQDVTYTYSLTSGKGNPNLVNTAVDNDAVSHTELFGPSLKLNNWSKAISLPTAFQFHFYGETVTHFRVSLNGVLTFDTTVTSVTTPNVMLNDNSNLPSTDLPNNSIACFWDKFASGGTGSDDRVYMAVKGSAPHRQVWIKWFSMKLSSNDNNYFACVLEEGSSNIYMVDMYNGGAASSLAVTVGIQKNATEASYILTTLKSTSTAVSDNIYFTYSPSYSTVSNAYYSATYLRKKGNPLNINTNVDNYVTGWTKLAMSSISTNKWSSAQSLPLLFSFKFFGESVTSFKVSANGVITFNTSAITLPGENTSLPSSSLPNKSIACFWDAFPAKTGSDDAIYIKAIGSAPNRQLWIKWVSMKYGSPACDGNYFACVLEETSNRVYIVDLRNLSKATTHSATVGLQLNSSTAVEYGSNLKIKGDSLSTWDNNFYMFTPVQESPLLSYTIPSASTLMGSLSPETDATTTGWTAITSGGISTNAWSAEQTMPFSFLFFGEAATKFKVTSNGLITFSTSTTYLPSENGNLPSAALPNKTIACFWDAFPGVKLDAADKVYIKTTGTSPNQQLWIKWYSMRTGAPYVGDNYYMCILEETTNKIYLVDQYYNKTSWTNNSMTVGLQYNSNYAVQYGNDHIRLSSSSTSLNDNNCYIFTPEKGDTQLVYTNDELSVNSTKALCSPYDDECLGKTVNAAYINLKLSAGEGYHFGSNNEFSEKVKFTLTPYTKTSTGTESAEQTLSIDQNNPVQLYRTSISDYENFVGYKVKIKEYSSSNSLVYDSLQLKAYYTSNLGIDVSSISVSTTAISSPVSSNPVTFSWSSPCEEVPGYELQILRLYNTSESYDDAESKLGNTTVDWSKALSIITESKETSFTLTLTEGTGYYLWRVRPIGTYYDGGHGNNQNWGNWSDSPEDGETMTALNSYGEIASKKTYLFYYQQFDNDKNFIYNRVFTEEGKVAEGISYANGLGMLKQSQRKLQEQDQIIAGQTLYDYVGRVGISTMTAPIKDQSSLGYIKKLVQDSTSEGSNLYGPDDFDSDERFFRDRYPICAGNAASVPKWENAEKMFGPISEYFSDENTDINIPNAGNYPYSRTVYDKLSRPKKQSLFGDEHRMGLYDETYMLGGLQRTIRTYYSAVGDTELMKVFGNETPADTGIYKIMRVDPNEVPTVEYKTLDGKTIATCLINTGDHPLLDDISESKDTIVKVIETQIQTDAYTLIKEQVIAFNEPTVQVDVDYELKKSDFEASCINYCSTCDYTITLYIIREETKEVKWSYTDTVSPEECGIDPLFNPDDTSGGESLAEFYNSTCAQLVLGTNNSGDASVIMLSDPGSYRIGRKITVNNKYENEGEARYRDYHQDTLTTLLDEEAAKFDKLFEYLDEEKGDLMALYEYLDGLAEGESSTCSEDDDNEDTKKDGKDYESPTAASYYVLALEELEAAQLAAENAVKSAETAYSFSVSKQISSAADHAENAKYYISRIITKKEECGDWDLIEAAEEAVDEAEAASNAIDANTGLLTSDKLKEYAASATEAAEAAEALISHYNFSHRFVDSEIIIEVDIDEISEAKVVGDIWQVSYQEGEEEGYGTYTLASSCLEIQVPRIPCDFNPAEAVWKETGTETWQKNLIAKYGGYYDFESVLFDKAAEESWHDCDGDPLASNIESYFFDSFGNSKFAEVTSDYPFDKSSSANGIFNSMVTHMIEKDNYDSYDLYLIWEEIVNNYPSLTEQFYDCMGGWGFEGLGLDLLDYFLEKAGKKYSGFADHPCGAGDGAAFLTKEGGVTSALSYDYGYGYLEYAYKSFKLDYEEYLAKYLKYYYDYNEVAEKIKNEEATEYEINWMENYGYIFEDADKIHKCAERYGVVFEKHIKDWTEPKGNNDLNQDGKISATDEEATNEKDVSIWDQDLCGSKPWYDGDVIADEVDESDSCKIWKMFYGCINSEFEEVVGHLDSISEGTDMAGKCDNTGDVACINEFSTVLKNRTLDVVSKRQLGFENRIRLTKETGIKAEDAFSTANLLREKLEETLDFTVQEDVEGNVTCVGSKAQLDLFQNLHHQKLEVSASNFTGATLVKGKESTTAEITASYLNARYRNKETLTKEEVEKEMDRFAKRTNWTTKTGAKFSSTMLMKSSSFSGGVKSFKRSVVATPMTFKASGGKVVISNVVDDKGTVSSYTVADYGTENKTVTIPSFYYKWGDKMTAIPETGLMNSLKIVDECDDRNLTYVANQIQYSLNEAKDCRLQNSLAEYDKNCTLPSSIDDSLVVSYTIDYHQYTLFYYDLAGNLIKTVPPKGVDVFDRDSDGDEKNDTMPSRADVKNHTYATSYKYNSIGQRTYEKTPDGGEKYFYYNNIGQLRFTEDAQQTIDGEFSYFKYDALGRLIESGLLSGMTTLADMGDLLDDLVEDDDFPNTDTYNGKHISRTHRIVMEYGNGSTTDAITYIDGTTEQANIDNRIYHSYYDLDHLEGGTDETHTYYSYDPHGNIEWMATKIGVMATKYVAYEYDLITGKVKEVKYNEDMKDQFYHRYNYDSDNRVTSVETSRDGVLWDVDAKYEYYAYGPLKRLSIGNDNIQGIDYVYTINGWLKGVNHQSLNPSYDPGGDGSASTSYAKDAFGMTLGYFNGDFKRGIDDGDGTLSKDDAGDQFSVYNSEFNTPESDYFNTGKNQLAWYYDTKNRYDGGANGYPDLGVNNTAAVNYRPLFNGTITNIAYSTQATPTAEVGVKYDGQIKGMYYNYDELYRLTESNFDYFDGSKWARESMSAVDDLKSYKTKYSYDKNGNITNLERLDNSGNLDLFSYHYENEKKSDASLKNNRLEYIDDNVTTSAYAYDLEDQKAGNYQYNEIGELISDKAENIASIEYTQRGKVSSVTKNITETDGSTTRILINFYYDALDNRVAKFSATTTKYGTTSQNITYLTTYYLRDAQGQVMAIYENDGSITKLVEQPISSGMRLGMVKPEEILSLSANEATSSETFTRTLEEKMYELKDYLGNVRAVVSDAKNMDTAATTYAAILLSSNDYYPYGMVLPGSDYKSGDYRYGFQGKERDDDVKNGGNSYDFGARIYDPRVGRWLSLDALASEFPAETPYNAMGNDPMNKVDPDGNAPFKFDDVQKTMCKNSNAAFDQAMYSAGKGQSEGRIDYMLAAGGSMLDAGANALGCLVMPTSEDIQVSIGLEAALGPGMGTFGAFSEYLAVRGRTLLKGSNSVSSIAKQVRILAGKPLVKSINDLPSEQETYKRLYRGTANPESLQKAHAMKGIADDQVVRGDQSFLSAEQASKHNTGGNFDPDGNVYLYPDVMDGITPQAQNPMGVSTSTDYETARKYGSHVVVYDIPMSVYNKLPIGDATQGERVFKGSIPEKYRIGTIER